MREETNLNEIELELLEQDVMSLHNIARKLEQTLGRGQLSDDVRHCADRLAALLKRC